MAEPTWERGACQPKAERAGEWKDDEEQIAPPGQANAPTAQMSLGGDDGDRSERRLASVGW